MLHQSVAAGRFLAKKLGYYPEDPLVAFEVDALIDDTYGDEKVFKGILTPNFIEDPDAREAAITKTFDEALPLLL